MRLAKLGVLASIAVTVAPVMAAAQTSLAPSAASGETVTPAFEGWYRNADGTYSLSFGYFNRNATEVVIVPVGPDNTVSWGDGNQGQPAYFYPRRHWGVFAVRVPADFGDKKTVVWTLKVRGKTFAIPGSLRAEWQIDALEGEAGSNNTPPELTIGDAAAVARGPGGITVDRNATVGKPITISVVAKDDGASATGRPSPVVLTWFAHQGPGQPSFGTPTARLAPTGGTSSTTVTFPKPGDYVVRVRATDSDVATAGHAQCCWTNAFVSVRVTP